MKTQSAAKVELVAKLAALIEERRRVESMEKELKALVREMMGEALVLEAGEFCVTISERNRRDLDKDAIMHDLGQDFIAKYTKITTYDVMDVKASKRQAVG